MATTRQHSRPCRIRPIFLALALTVLARVPLSAQDNCIQISRESREPLSTLPGQVVNASVRVFNPSTIRQTYDTRIVLPGGWRNLTGEPSFDLEPGASDIRLLSIAVPPTAQPGSYEIHLSVSNTTVPPCWTTFTLDLSVEPLRNLQLQVVETPRFAVAGQPCKAVVAVKNLGNETCSVRLSVRAGQGWTAHPDSNRLTLGPRDVKNVAVQLLTDPSLSQNFRYVLEVRAVLEQDTTVTAISSFPVEVVPNLSAGSDLYHQVPLTAKLRAAGQEGTGAGTQIEVASAGTFTDKSKDRYELFLRTPDIQSRSVLGYRDEYRLAYFTELYQLEFGDKSYELTPLTELARNAFGLEGKARLGDFTLGGFVNKTRFFSPVQKEQAGFIRYGMDSLNSASLNFLRKDDRITSNAVTARGMIRPFGQTDLDLEVGLSSMSGVGDQAFAGRVQGVEQGVAYDVRYVRAGTNFGGYYRDVEFKSASFNLQPWKIVRFEFYGRDQRRNLSMDTLLFIAPRDQYYLFGAVFPDLFSAYYRVNDQADRLPNAKYAARENALQLRSGYTFPLCSVIGSVEFGSTDDRILRQQYPFQRYQASANIRPDSYQSYGAGIEYSNERFFNAGESTGRWTGTLSAAFFPARGTEILASLQGSRTAPPFVQTYSLADISVQYQFPFGHQVGVRARQSIFTPSTNGKELAYLLEYTVPLSIPVSPISTSGQLRGRAVDSSGAGVAGVILYAGGGTAITDESGEFLFPALRPEEYALQVDLGSHGMDMVSAVPSPMDVIVRGGERTDVEIRLIPGATVAGSVVLYGFPQPPETTKTAYVRLRGQSGVLVELSREGEQLRRITDNRGEYQFSNIRPGTWKLKILDGNLPDHTYLEQDSLTSTIAPREKQSFEFRILPQKRKIQILQEGMIQPEKPAPAPALPKKKKTTK